MKKYYLISEHGSVESYYVGETADIKAMYKSILRNRTSNLRPMFCDFPKFSDNKSIYALCIDEFAGWVSIVNSDTMLAMIISNEVYEVL